MNRLILDIENTMREIKKTFALNENMRSLLLLDDPTLNQNVSVKQALENIFLLPIIEVGTTEPFNKKTYICITVPDATRDEPEDLTSGIILRITVQCERSHWTYMEDNLERVRPLQIAQLIIDAIENENFGLTNPIKFHSMVETRTDSYTYGYSVLFNTETGVGNNDR